MPGDGEGFGELKDLGQGQGWRFKSGLLGDRGELVVAWVPIPALAFQIHSHEHLYWGTLV